MFEQSKIIFPIVGCILILILICVVLIVYIKKQKNLVNRKTIAINKKPVFSFLKRKKAFDSQEVKDFAVNLSNSLARLSADKVGGLIVIENKDRLSHYVRTGNEVDTPFFSELVFSIFYNHSSPLHDGAIIVKNWRIRSLSAYLPITKKVTDVKYGARHRAAFGITEVTDAIVFVVSETYGSILCIFNNNIFQLDNKPAVLVDQILEILFNYYHKLIGKQKPKIEKIS